MQQEDYFAFFVTSGVGYGQGDLVCYSPWGHEESDMTWRLNSDSMSVYVQ